MLSFVCYAGTAQGPLSFYINEQSSNCYLISVVDRKNKTHLFNFNHSTSSWQSAHRIEDLPFWKQGLQTCLMNAIREEKMRWVEQPTSHQPT
ncbi:MAG: hypothetical protein EOO10_20950 [Chitinophagaceae bacterium]|nr:MAG: hypothetical protein EOO10_20950 [Chitinophagaceae bacterium]